MWENWRPELGSPDRPVDVEILWPRALAQAQSTFPWGSRMGLKNIINDGPGYVASFFTVCVSEDILMEPEYCSGNSGMGRLSYHC